MSWRSHLEQQHGDRRTAGLWRQRQIVESPQGPVVTVAGKTYHNFCSNDYLGLANDPRLGAAAVSAIQNFGVGSGASHLICGHQTAHHQLETKLAAFMGTEKALVFSTGYMANLAIAQAFLGREDFIVQDKLNHASLIDAGRHCDAKLLRYLHTDMQALAQRLSSTTTGRTMIATDSVFSMDGDIAPLPVIKQLADQHDALLAIDEAHGLGVLGQGRGAAAAVGIRPTGNILVMGTLGKALGSFGAFVAGDTPLIDHLIQFGRTYTYTTALPPHVIAATSAALHIIQTSDQHYQRLINNITYFRQQLATLATLAAKSDKPSIADRFLPSTTPIQPLMIGSAETAMKASDFLRRRGFLVTAIRPPTVPANQARLRFTLSAAHQQTSIQALLDRLNEQEFQQILATCPIPSEDNA